MTYKTLHAWTLDLLCDSHRQSKKLVMDLSLQVMNFVALWYLFCEEGKEYVHFGILASRVAGVHMCLYVWGALQMLQHIVPMHEAALWLVLQRTIKEPSDGLAHRCD
jgi:hypothetical protein